MPFSQFPQDKKILGPAESGAGDQSAESDPRLAQFTDDLDFVCTRYYQDVDHCVKWFGSAVYSGLGQKSLPDVLEVDAEQYQHDQDKASVVHRVLVGALVHAVREDNDFRLAQYMITYYRIPSEDVQQLLQNVVREIRDSKLDGTPLLDEFLPSAAEFCAETALGHDLGMALGRGQEIRSRCAQVKESQELYEGFCGDHELLETMLAREVTRHEYLNDDGAQDHIHVLLEGALAYAVSKSHDYRAADSIKYYYGIEDNVVRALAANVWLLAFRDGHQRSTLESGFGLSVDLSAPQALELGMERNVPLDSVAKAGVEASTREQEPELTNPAALLNDVEQCLKLFLTRYQDMGSRALDDPEALCSVTLKAYDKKITADQPADFECGIVHSMLLGAMAYSYFVELEHYSPAHAIIDHYSVSQEIFQAFADAVMAFAVHEKSESEDDLEGFGVEFGDIDYLNHAGEFGELWKVWQEELSGTNLSAYTTAAPSDSNSFNVGECLELYGLKLLGKTISDGTSAFVGHHRDAYLFDDSVEHAVHEVLVGALASCAGQKRDVFIPQQIIEYYQIRASKVLELIGVVSDALNGTGADFLREELGFHDIPESSIAVPTSSSGFVPSETQLNVDGCLHSFRSLYNPAAMNDPGVLTKASIPDYNSKASVREHVHTRLVGALAYSVFSIENFQAAHALIDRFHIHREIVETLIEVVCRRADNAQKSPEGLLREFEYERKGVAEAEFIPSDILRDVGYCVTEFHKAFEFPVSEESLESYCKLSRQDYESDPLYSEEVHLLLVGALNYASCPPPDYLPAHWLIEKYGIDARVVHKLADIVSDFVSPGRDTSPLREHFGLPPGWETPKASGATAPAESPAVVVTVSSQPAAPAFTPSRFLQQVQPCLALFEANFDSKILADEPDCADIEFLSGVSEHILISDYKSSANEYASEVIHRHLVGAMAHAVFREGDLQPALKLIDYFGVDDEVVQSCVRVVADKASDVDRDAGRLLEEFPLPECEEHSTEEGGGSDEDTAPDLADVGQAPFAPSMEQKDVEGCYQLFSRQYIPASRLRASSSHVSDSSRLCSLTSDQYADSEHPASADLVHRLLVGALQYSIADELDDFQPAFNLISKYDIQEPVVRTLVDNASRFASAGGEDPSSLRLFFGYAPEVPGASSIKEDAPLPPLTGDVEGESAAGESRISFSNKLDDIQRSKTAFSNLFWSKKVHDLAEKLYEKVAVEDYCTVAPDREEAHSYLVGALVYGAVEFDSYEAAKEVVECYQISEEVVADLASDAYLFLLSQGICEESLIEEFRSTGQPPVDSEFVFEAAVKGSVKHARQAGGLPHAYEFLELSDVPDRADFMRSAIVLSNEERTREVGTCLTAYENGITTVWKDLDEFQGLLYEKVAERDYKSQDWDRKRVHKFLVAALVNAAGQDDDFGVARKIQDSYDIDDSVVEGIVLDVCVYSLSHGRDITQLREEFNVSEEILSEDCVTPLSLMGAKHLLDSNFDVAGGLQLLAANNVSAAAATGAYVDQFWENLATLKLIPAARLILDASLSEEDLLAKNSEGGEQFLRTLALEFGKGGPKEVVDTRPLLQVIAQTLQIDESDVEKGLFEAFRDRIDNGDRETALEIATQYELDPERVREYAVNAIPKLFFAGKVEAALELTLEYDLISTLQSHPKFRQAARICLVRQLEGKEWARGLPELFDSGLITEQLQQDPLVRSAVYNRLVAVVNKKPTDPMEVTLVVSLFGMGRPEIIDRTSSRVSRMLMRGDVQTAKRVMKSHEITLLTPGAERIREIAAEAIATPLRTLDFKTANQLRDDFGVKPENLNGSGTSIAGERVRIGDIPNAEAIGKWLGIGDSSVLLHVPEEDVRAGVAVIAQRGWSEQLQSMAILCSDTKDQVLRGLPAEVREECIAAELRGADWERVLQAQGAFQISDEQLVQIATDQLEEVMAVGDPSRVSSILVQFDLEEDAYVETALKAIGRAYRMSDVRRVEAILEAIPSARAAIHNTETEGLVVEAYRELLRAGWKGKVREHFQVTFGVNHDELEGLEADVLLGVQAELAAGEIDFAERFVEEMKMSKGILLQAILKADESELRARAKDIEELGAALEKESGSIWKVLGTEHEGLVLPELRDRIRRHELFASYLLGELFHFDDDAIELVVAEQGFAQIHDGEVHTGLTLMELFDVTETVGTLPLNQVVPDPDSWRASHKVPAEVATIDQGLEYFRKLSGFESVKASGTPKSPASAKPTHNEIKTARAQLADRIAADPEAVHCISDVPHYGQKTGHTCGAASARMAVEAATGVEYSEKAMAEWLGTTQELGTPLNHYTRLNEKFPEVEILVSSGGSMKGLKELLQRGYSIIVNYHIGIEPHYGVIKSIASNGIVLSDPMSGANTGLSFNTFDWRGGYDETRVRCGYVAMRLRSDVNPDDLVEQPANLADPEPVVTTRYNAYDGDDNGIDDYYGYCD